MAVEGNRERAANVGHHQLGRLITLADGTKAFLPSNVLVNAAGVPITSISTNGVVALDIHNADVHSEIINTPIHSTSATSTTLAADAVQGATVITLADPTGFTVTDRIELHDGTNFQLGLPNILAVNGSIITIDRPLDNLYASGTAIASVTANMALAVGSLASPVLFEAETHTDDVWHITRINLSMLHKSLGSDDAFGSLTALTNGVVVRVVTAREGTRTLANWKTNQDMAEDMYDVRYTSRSGPSAFGTHGRWSIEGKMGAVIRLDGATNDHIKVLIQDDLTASSNELIDFQIKIQGHVE